MSSVTVPMYHYALLKGYLSGQDAPTEVLTAVEALYMAAVQGPLRTDALEAIQAVKDAAERLAGVATVSSTADASTNKAEPTVALPESVEPDLPPITKRALEKAAERPKSEEQTQSDEAKIAVYLDSGAVQQCPPSHASGGGHEVVVGPSQPKKQKKWSPEARAAAAERMRAMQARKRAQRNAKEAKIAEPESPSFTEKELRITVPIKQRKTQLTDDDWPEIKTRIAEGDSREAIAGDYDEELEDLEFFIASNQRREAKQSPGEARAPLPSLAGGAG